jgi:ATP-dependent exoDNAse (exonuclease V) beta subunit
MDHLSKQHPHPNDNHITFEEGPHIYTIAGNSSYTSVTTFNHQHFEPFNATKIINNMMRSKNWPKSNYYGQTPKEIKAGWEENRVAAATAGTNMHYDIECYYNNIEPSNNSVEYEYFKAFATEYQHLKPYRTEWMIYDKELQLAGSIDMIFENEDGTLSIYDWKRSKEIKKTSSWNKFSKTECIEHIPDTNYWHYCLQLNTYKAILEKNYNKQIKDMYLVCLHPDNKNHSYQRIKVVALNKEISALFDLRKQQLKH